MSFANKEALIIGGSSGMGLEAARLLVHAGASVTLTGRRKEKLEKARETFNTPDKVHIVQCDLAKSGEVESLVRRVRDEIQDVKFLINAAGVFTPKSFLEHTYEDYDVYMDLNRATFFVTQQVAKNMAVSGVWCGGQHWLDVGSSSH